MRKVKNSRAIALLVVLGTILLVVLLAMVMLRPISSQSRITHHQVARVQAYYAALAGTNYAYDKLMRGDPAWPIPAVGSSYNFELTSIDTNFPHCINSVLITVAADNKNVPGVPGCNPCNAPTGIPVCICTTVDYATP